MSGCIAYATNGTCIGHRRPALTTATTRIFGDLGNDWIVGGTGKDTLWGGWGNDLLQRRRRLPRRQQRRPQRRPADDRDTHPLRGPRLRRRRPRHPDRQHRRRPADRLGRRVQQLPRPVRAVRHRHRQPPGAAGAPRVPLRALAQPGRRPDPRQRHRHRRRSATASRTARSASIAQKDHGLWQDQTGGPTDPQAGQHPRRPPRRPARRRTSTTARSTLRRRQRRVAVATGARSQVGRGLARRRRRGLLPRRLPADLLRDRAAGHGAARRRAAGRRNAYVIFDYFSPTDFKFAGIDVSTNKLVHRAPDDLGLGHRQAVAAAGQAGHVYDMLVRSTAPP